MWVNMTNKDLKDKLYGIPVKTTSLENWMAMQKSGSVLKVQHILDSKSGYTISCLSNGETGEIYVFSERKIEQ